MKLKFSIFATLAIIAIAMISIGFAYQKSRTDEQRRSEMRSQENVPIAQLNKTEFDWGKIPRRDPVMQDFALKNGGGAPLMVTKVVTSCSCTTAELWQNGQPIQTPYSLPPQESIVIKVTFDPALHDSRGISKRAVRIETSDPVNPFLIINLLANVE